MSYTIDGNRKYFCFWILSANDIRTGFYTGDFFSEDNGYDLQDLRRIGLLNVGALYTLLPDHMILRLPSNFPNFKIYQNAVQTFEYLKNYVSQEQQDQQSGEDEGIYEGPNEGLNKMMDYIEKLES